MGNMLYNTQCQVKQWVMKTYDYTHVKLTYRHKKYLK